MPFNIGPGELIIVLIIALIVVGPGKLPDVGSALGKSIREFRKAATDVKESTSLETPAPAPVAAAAVPATAASAISAVSAAPAPAPVAAPAPLAATPAPAPVAAEPAPAPVAAAPVAAETVTPAAAPGNPMAEPAGGWPAELTPTDEQPTPSA
jgi:TatA/E family protein of Tat protein translocase